VRGEIDELRREIDTLKAQVQAALANAREARELCNADRAQRRSAVLDLPARRVN
jgi:hypothetical protein